jgi:hypothetical protein
MHFHLPKPLHGWREFAGEVGIIVLGVLIALGAGVLLRYMRIVGVKSPESFKREQIARERAMVGC